METPSPVEQLLAAPRRRQRKLAERLGLTRCIEEAIDAYYTAPAAKGDKIEVLLNRLYHWLESDMPYRVPLNGSVKVLSNRSRFYRAGAGEKAADGVALLLEALLAIPVLGPLVFFLLMFAIMVVGIILYAATLPFPFIRRPVNRYLDSFNPPGDFHFDRS